MIRNIINGIIKTQVSDVNARKSKLKGIYLSMQYNQFGDFDVVIEYDFTRADKTAINTFKSVVYNPPEKIVGR